MQTSKNDIWVGLFVLIGAAAILFLALQSANLLSLNFEKTYQVVGRFDNAGGVKPKAAVRSAGVVVGRVEDIRFDDKSFQAKVVLAMDARYQFPKDSSLKILTSGLLGEQYIGIEPGGDERNIAACSRPIFSTMPGWPRRPAVRCWQTCEPCCSRSAQRRSGFGIPAARLPVWSTISGERMR